MNPSKFIARKLGGEGAENGHLSKISNRIAWISVAISVGVMIIAVMIVAGFKSEIREKAVGFSGAINLVAPGQVSINEKYPSSDSISFRKEILDIKGVNSLHSVAYCSGLLKTNDNIQGVYFKGVDPFYDFSFFKSALVEGHIPDYNGRIGNDIMISKRLANKLGYKLGDSMVAYFIGNELKVRKFTICGLFDAQLEEIDMTHVIVDKRHVQRLNGWKKDQVSAIEVNIDANCDIESTGKAVASIIYEYSTKEDSPFFVLPVTRIYSHLFDWLALLDFNVLIVLILMMAVAGFNMISALLIILFEKISMIGLLKSLGMTNWSVVKVFLYRAFHIVKKGLLWGNAVAVLFYFIQKYFKVITLNPENYFVKYVPVKLDIASLLIIDVISMAVIMLILMLSSIFVSRVSPDKTLRVE
ncbi:MAG: ABC transporter permease [Bacteroidales bacterium]|nr:ABC transporter permease [Bacteroidales bacterium]